MANIARMTKKQLVAHGKKVGANLNMDQTRKEMIAEIRSNNTKVVIEKKPKDFKMSTKAKKNVGGLEVFPNQKQSVFSKFINWLFPS